MHDVVFSLNQSDIDTSQNLIKLHKKLKKSIIGSNTRRRDKRKVSEKDRSSKKRLRIENDVEHPKKGASLVREQVSFSATQYEEFKKTCIDHLELLRSKRLCQTPFASGSQKIDDLEGVEVVSSSEGEDTGYGDEELYGIEYYDEAPIDQDIPEDEYNFNEAIDIIYNCRQKKQEGSETTERGASSIVDTLNMPDFMPISEIMKRLPKGFQDFSDTSDEYAMNNFLQDILNGYYIMNYANIKPLETNSVIMEGSLDYYGEMYKNKDLPKQRADVTFVCGEGTCKVHSYLLNKHSSCFSIILTGDLKESDSGVIKIDPNEETAENIQVFVKALYYYDSSGLKYLLATLHHKEILAILRLSDFYQCYGLYTEILVWVTANFATAAKCFAKTTQPDKLILALVSLRDALDIVYTFNERYLLTGKTVSEKQAENKDTAVNPPENNNDYADAISKMADQVCKILLDAIIPEMGKNCVGYLTLLLDDRMIHLLIDRAKESATTTVTNKTINMNVLVTHWLLVRFCELDSFCLYNQAVTDRFKILLSQLTPKIASRSKMWCWKLLKSTVRNYLLKKEEEPIQNAILSVFIN